MAKSKWSNIKVGDFFISNIDIEGNTHLYQKIDDTKTGGYNAVLLNTGDLCNLYISADTTNFQKVTVTFDYKPITE
jgi:hypothetical protein